VDLLLCSQLSGHIPRPPKGGAAAEATEGFYSIFTDPRKVCFSAECSSAHLLALVGQVSHANEMLGAYADKCLPEGACSCSS
jgi:hypothetical protein